MSGAGAATARSSSKLRSAARHAGGSGAPSAKRRVLSSGRLDRRVIGATNIVARGAARARRRTVGSERGVQSLRLRYSRFAGFALTTGAHPPSTREVISEKTSRMLGAATSASEDVLFKHKG